MDSSSAPPPPLSSYKLLAFDLMGTLLDEKTGVLSALQPIRHKVPSSLSDADLFEHFEELTRKHIKDNTPSSLSYEALLARVTEDLISSLSNGKETVSDDESAAVGRSIQDWPAFPDTVAALQTLSNNKGCILVPVTNMDAKALDTICKSGALQGIPFARRLSSTTTQAFKPSTTVFDYLLNLAKTEFGVEKRDVLMVAQGLKSDHKVCNEMDIRSAWIDRLDILGEKGVPSGIKYDWRFASLEEFVEAM